jgi:hypothetical protein
MSRLLFPLLVVFVLPLAPAAAQDRGDLADRLVKLPGDLARSKKSDADCLDALFLATLVRLPSDAERETAARHVARAKDREQGLQDVTFALINTKEFLKLQGLDTAAGLEFVNKIGARWEQKK